MKHNILPDEWCVANCKQVHDYINSKVGYMRYTGDGRAYYGFDKEKNGYRCHTNPFGQLLTEEQFLYCIGEPTEGEAIQVSVTEHGLIGAIEMTLLMHTDDGAWCLANNMATNAVFFKHYRRKPLVFEVDKWAKEKAAFAEGKTIQYLKEESGWADILHIPLWSSCDEYRIKPEPKYTPFTREDWDLFKMKEVCNNPDDGVVVVIISCDDDGVRCGSVECTYRQAFDSIVFADGTPFGKLIEE